MTLTAPLKTDPEAIDHLVMPFNAKVSAWGQDIVLEIKDATKKPDIIAVMEKSGWYWILNVDDEFAGLMTFSRVKEEPEDFPYKDVSVIRSSQGEIIFFSFLLLLALFFIVTSHEKTAALLFLIIPPIFCGYQLLIRLFNSLEFQTDRLVVRNFPQKRVINIADCRSVGVRSGMGNSERVDFHLKTGETVQSFAMPFIKARWVRDEIGRRYNLKTESLSS